MAEIDLTEIHAQDRCVVCAFEPVLGVAGESEMEAIARAIVEKVRALEAVKLEPIPDDRFDHLPSSVELCARVVERRCGACGQGGCSFCVAAADIRAAEDEVFDQIERDDAEVEPKETEDERLASLLSRALCERHRPMEMFVRQECARSNGATVSTGTA